MKFGNIDVDYAPNVTKFWKWPAGHICGCTGTTVNTSLLRLLHSESVHTTRVDGPCWRPVNIGALSVNIAHFNGPWWRPVNTGIVYRSVHAVRTHLLLAGNDTVPTLMRRGGGMCSIECHPVPLLNRTQYHQVHGSLGSLRSISSAWQ